MLGSEKQGLSLLRPRDEGAGVTGIEAAKGWGVDGGEVGLATPASVTPLVALSRLGAQARAYAEDGHAAATRRAYGADWRDFTAWCAARGLVSLPATPATLALYVTDRAERLKVSTLQRRLAAIAQAHRLRGQPAPTEGAGFRAVWRGIRRAKGTAQVGKAALLVNDLRAMVLVVDLETAIGVRDRALLLLGFAGAFRRSELVALDIGDVQVTRDGLVVTIRRSKTDQEGTGQKVGIPRGRHAGTCPVQALQAWLERAGIEAGPIFRGIDRHGRILPGRLTAQSVALVVRRVAEAAGLDPAQYAGHSLRAGLATAAALAGAEERDIMRQTRHTSVTVARRYIRDGSLFRDNAAAAVGL
jgi:integrase